MMMERTSSAQAQAQLRAAVSPANLVPTLLLQQGPALALAIFMLIFTSGNPPETSSTCLTPAQLNCSMVPMGGDIALLIPNCTSAEILSPSEVAEVADNWRQLVDTLQV